MALGAVVWISTLLRLCAGILAVQDPSAPVDVAEAARYADAAMHAAEARHVDPWELVGVARQESRFRADEIGPDGKDCGIVQTRTTGSRYSCRQLRRNIEIAFRRGRARAGAVQRELPRARRLRSLPAQPLQQRLSLRAQRLSRPLLATRAVLHAGGARRCAGRRLRRRAVARGDRACDAAAVAGHALARATLRRRALARAGIQTSPGLL